MSTTTPAAETAAKPVGKKKMMIIVVGVLALAGAAYWFLLKPAPAEAEEKAKPVPGEVVALEPIQINLAGGHYLRMGIALQLTAEVAHGAPDGSKALDAAIDLFSGLPIEHVTQTKHRMELKKELKKELDHLYHHEVMDVYFTDFVTQ